MSQAQRSGGTRSKLKGGRKSQTPRVALAPKSGNTITPQPSGKPPDGDLMYDLGDGNQREVQDTCFTPRRSLRHSPSKRRTLSGSDNGASPVVLQKSLIGAGVNSHSVTNDENRPKSSRTSPSSSKPSSSHLSLKAKQPETKNTHPSPRASRTPKRADTSDGTPCEQRVQAACFTPRNSLQRSPLSQRKGPLASSESLGVDLIPPPTRWELPRTPVQMSDTTTEKCERSGSRGSPIDETCFEGQQNSHKSLSEVKNQSTVSGEPPATENSTSLLVPTQRVQLPSPPITVSKEPVVSALPGLVCNENDLAYLQRMKSIKQYEHLQTQVNQLDKAIKAAAEQKEQLQHEALKVNQDLADMRARYQETVTDIHTLISNPAAALSPRPSQTPTPQLPPEAPLSQAHVAKLKRMHQLTAAQLEKTDRELKSKLLEVGRAKEKLHKKIREEEQRAEQEILEAQLRASKEQITEWQLKVRGAREEQDALEEKLKALQRKLARLKVVESQPPEEGGGGEEGEQERKRAEERLRRVIRRCELYVQRHQMLREMGIRPEHSRGTQKGNGQ